MLGRLRDLLSSAMAPTQRDNGLHLAAAVLLMEAAALDGHLDDVEYERIVSLLSGHFQLSDADARALADQARHKADHAVELSGFARTLKNGMDMDGRIRLIEMLWDVAYADGHLHDFEANLVRRAAGLLYVPDVEAGAARKRVLARLGLS